MICSKCGKESYRWHKKCAFCRYSEPEDIENTDDLDNDGENIYIDWNKKLNQPDLGIYGEYLKNLSSKKSNKTKKNQNLINDTNSKNTPDESLETKLINKTNICDKCSITVEKNYNFCTNCGSKTQNKFTEIKWNKLNQNRNRKKIFFWVSIILILSAVVTIFLQVLLKANDKIIPIIPPTVQATPKPQPTLIPQPTAVPQPTSTPKPQPTAIPTVQPTSSPTPMPTSTPTSIEIINYRNLEWPVQKNLSDLISDHKNISQILGSPFAFKGKVIFVEKESNPRIILKSIDNKFVNEDNTNIVFYLNCPIPFEITYTTKKSWPKLNDDVVIIGEISSVETVNFNEFELLMTNPNPLPNYGKFGLVNGKIVEGNNPEKACDVF